MFLMMNGGKKKGSIKQHGKVPKKIKAKGEKKRKLKFWAIKKGKGERKKGMIKNNKKAEWSSWNTTHEGRDSDMNVISSHIHHVDSEENVWTWF